MNNSRYNFIFKISFIAYPMFMIARPYISAQTLADLFMLLFIIAIIYQFAYLSYFRKKENIKFTKALKTFIIYAITAVSIYILIDYANHFINGYTPTDITGNPIDNTYYGFESIKYNNWKNIFYIPYLTFNLIIIVANKMKIKNKIEIEKSYEYWDKVHSKYNRDEIKCDDWLDLFKNIIANCKTPIIDLGCGSGNDTLYLINMNKNVIACDQSINAISNIKSNFPEVYDIKCFNMLDGLPFEDNSSELIIADLCLHYFRKDDTFKIVNEIKRVLKPNGYLILRVNSINDINHGARDGRKIENHLYMTKDNRLKRFFDEKDFYYFFEGFDTEYLKEETMSRYRLEKKLYRACLKNIK